MPAGTEPIDLVNREALRRTLLEVLPSADDVDVSLLSGGASNLTFQVRVDGNQYVLRRRPLGPTAARAHDMRREFTVISALNATDFPVPRALRFSDDRSVVGAPFYLMEFIDGVALHTKADVAHFDERSARACGDALIDTLTALHAVVPEGVGLQAFGRPQNFLERRITSWLRQWDSVEHREFPEVEALGRRLLERLPPSGGSTLVHGDYRLGNVLFARTASPRLVAVLDWEMSTLGDPLTDLAHLLVYWEPTRGRRTHPAQEIAGHPGFPAGRELAERYSDATGRDITALPYYLAFEHWRAAIIKDAIYLRAQVNSAGEASDHAAELGQSVSHHLAEARDVLDDLRTSTT